MSACCATSAGAEPAGVPWTLGGLLRRFLPTAGPALRLSGHQRRVLARLADCGTLALGENLFACPHCGATHWAPRSCGDRHCPRCLAGKSRQWLARQQQSLLPVTYYHCVFTLPAELRALALRQQGALYQLLFDSAAGTLLEFGRNHLGGDLGVTAVLHTWGQQLGFHPHLHCIVTGGALSADQRRWRAPKQRRFLFPVRAMGALFRGKFLAGLQELLQDPAVAASAPPPGRVRARWLRGLYHTRWVVYAKRPFGGPAQVLSYLANYTHRVALSNRRIVAVDEPQQRVTFTYRDYRDGGQVKRLSLKVAEFFRRFALHILPPKLVRIRHYGILSNNRRREAIAAARTVLARRRRPTTPPAATAPPGPPAPTPGGPGCCPRCGQPGLRLLGFTDAHGVFHAAARPGAACDSS